MLPMHCQLAHSAGAGLMINSGLLRACKFVTISLATLRADILLSRALLLCRLSLMLPLLQPAWAAALRGGAAVWHQWQWQVDTGLHPGAGDGCCCCCCCCCMAGRRDRRGMSF